jgi:hypothetical protein
VAELVDAQDLKSCFPQRKYGFDSRLGHEAPDHSRGFCISGEVPACQGLESSGRGHKNLTEEAAVYNIQHNYQGATANATTFGRFITALIYKLGKFIRLRDLQ